LFNKRSIFSSAIHHRISLTTLPLWFVLRAATQIEDANESNRPTSSYLIDIYFSIYFLFEIDLATIVEQLDTMFDKEEYQKAYEYIEKNRTNEYFQNYYIQWRIARIFYKLSLITNDKELKRKLIEEGFEQVKLALQPGNHIYSVHKWYGILLNEKSQYTSTNEQIRSAYEVLDHFEEAIRLNPQDPTCYYLLGSW
jgi:tetratricopeptide (TPR) repeat protein